MSKNTKITKEQKRKKKKEKQARKRLRKQVKNQQRIAKDNNMFGLGKSKKTTSYWQRGTIPETGMDSGLLSTVLFKQSTLNEIGAICLPTAGGSEFQVHYRCLQLVISKPEVNERLAVTIPTVFFNMPQKVSTASVDFNLNEVAEISEKVAPVSEALAEKYYKAFPIEFFKSLGYEIDARETEIGSMHRHPGAFGFSATDLDNKAENPGVIFRTVNTEDRIQVDSVMYIPNNKVNIFTTETRVIDVKPVSDGIEGTYFRTPTMSYILEDVEDAVVGFGSFFGRKEISKQEISFKFNKDSIKDDYPEMEEIMKNFIATLKANGEEYSPVLIIDPEMIEQEYSYYATPYQRGTGYHKPAISATRVNPRETNNFYSGYDDEFEGSEYSYLDDQEAPTETNVPLETRPSWRKIQTLGAIVDLGIDANNSLNIDGTGSVKDIRAIRRAMRVKDYSDREIEDFFITYGYTERMLKAADDAVA